MNPVVSTDDSSGTSSRFSAGQLIAGRYRIEECLGAGGMGSVYRVADTELKGALVVLKLLHPEFGRDPEMFERFRNEVLLARSLVHPNIGRTFDIGKTEHGEYFLTMEYIEGSPLKDLIRRPQGEKRVIITPDQLDDAVLILQQILDGVGHAHDQGVIHRDLKPANVLVTKTGVVKIVDFGTARLIGDGTGITKTGQIIGTPAYMPPEQIEGRPLGRSCDIYAVGMIGYELMAGKAPFAAENYIQALYKQVHEPLPALGIEVSGVPVWYEQAIAKAAAKDPAERFETAAQFKTALQTANYAAVHSAPSRTGNLLILGAFVCLVLGFGSYLAYLYNPPPQLAGPDGQKNSALENSSEETIKAGQKKAAAEPQNSADSTINIHERTPVEPGPQVKADQPPVQDAEAGKETAPLPETTNIPMSKTPALKIETEEPVKKAAAPSEVKTDLPAGPALFLRLPGLAPAAEFSAAELREIRWVAELGDPRGLPSNFKAQLKLSKSGQEKILFQSAGSILQSSPEVKAGGNFSAVPQLAAGRYQARIEIEPAAGGPAIKSAAADFTVR